MNKLKLLPWQQEVFTTRLSDKEKIRFKLVHKGRRLGSTVGQVMYCFLNMVTDSNDQTVGKLREKTDILWVDTTYSQIKLYQEKFFIPFLRKYKIPHKLDSYGNRLTFGNKNEIHFRSATRPELMEGLSYDIAIGNESGIIFNDNDAKLWFTTILPMLLDNPESEAILSGTPKGKNGFYKLKESGSFKTYQYTTYDNTSLSRTNVDTLSASYINDFRRQEIFGEFIDYSDGMIKKVDYFDPSEYKWNDMEHTVIGVDLAISTSTAADYTAMAAIGKKNNKLYIFDIEQYKIGTDHDKLIKQFYDRYPSNEVIVEQVGFQKLVVNDLMMYSSLPIIGKNVSKDKITRFLPAANKIESGIMKFSTAIEKKYIMDILAFPNPKVHDDIVDAISITMDSFYAGDDIGFIFF